MRHYISTALAGIGIGTIAGITCHDIVQVVVLTVGMNLVYLALVVGIGERKD